MPLLKMPNDKAKLLLENQSSPVSNRITQHLTKTKSKIENKISKTQKLLLLDNFWRTVTNYRASKNAKVAGQSKKAATKKCQL